MTHAVVLIRAERDALPDLGGALAELDGVAEAYSVTGEWDFVAILRVARQDDLARVVTELGGSAEVLCLAGGSTGSAGTRRIPTRPGTPATRRCGWITTRTAGSG